MNKEKLLFKLNNREQLLSLLIFVLSAIVIILAANGELWLDEIWTLYSIKSFSSSLNILTDFRHDNNHLLNTLYLYIIGDQHNFIIYRLFSIISGIGSIFLIGLICRGYNLKASIIAMILSGSSYPLILYFTEARGYAPAIFFSTLSFAILIKSIKSNKLYMVILFWISTILGLLSHLLFVMILFSFSAMIFVHYIQKKYSPKKILIKLCVYFCVPSFFFIILYLFFIRNISIGGGPVYNKWSVIEKASCMLLGIPFLPVFGLMSFLLVLCILFFGTTLLFKNNCNHWIFFPFVIFITPVLLLLFTRPKYFYFRYFILAFPFFYILLGYLLEKLYSSKFPLSKWIVSIFLLFFVIGHSQRILPLIQLGRGSYGALLEHISRETPKEIIYVSSNHDFINKRMIFFYSRFIPNRKKILYLDYNNWGAKKPYWIITQNQDLFYKPVKKLTIPTLGEYNLNGEFIYSGVSGFNWYLYRLNKDF